MARLVDINGDEAHVGSLGYWLDNDDFISTTGCDARGIAEIGFPRDWPNVYGASKALKQLIGKKRALCWQEGWSGCWTIK